MQNKNSEPDIPSQHTGAQTDAETIETFDDAKDARQFFQIAKQRLLNVNAWHELCGPLSADFQMTDADGNPLQRLPLVGDLFKIDIPGPGTAAGKGYDWVQVEAIEEKQDKESDSESIVVRVRPTQNPLSDKSDVAHFYTGEATSNFTLTRQQTKVCGGVHGRNEVPNTADVDNVLDKARNAIIGSTALAGISTAQWKTLVNAWMKRS